VGLREAKKTSTAQRIVDTAMELFEGRQFGDVSVDEIARTAGVGRRTFFRYYPTKEDLVAALADDRFATTARLARETLEQDDPWEAFCDYMRRAAEIQAQDLALSEAMASRPAMMAGAAVSAGMPDLLAELVDRAKAAGALRPDAEWQDVPMMICGLGRIVQAHGNDAPFMSWERLLALLLDGMRAPGTTPLPPR